MAAILLNVTFIICFLLSVYFFSRRRKKAGITGMKSALTSVCFFLIAIINFSANLFDFLGIVSW
ncbi:hypothetical protein [Halobacillus sp. BBL2006]|uniref:hypothetical protein n=1 Tax=Halobacillus sp. BBL2006 TaxID=1543706 RepID=UPI00069248D8